MNNLIKNLNNFGISIVNSNLPKTIFFNNKYYLNKIDTCITFFKLSKYFPEYIIIDIANKLQIPLKKENIIISKNWMIDLDKNFVIKYMLLLYEKQLDYIQNDNIINNSNVIIKKKNYKKKSIPITLKRKVWDFWVGESVGKTKCPCCKLTDITQLNFSCGHIISEYQGGSLSVQNLKPICASCNSSMGIKNMDEFIKQYGL